MFYILIAVPIFLFFAAVIGVGMWYFFVKNKVDIPQDISTTKKLKEVDPNKNRGLLLGAGLFLSLLLTILIIESFTREIKIIEEVFEGVFEEDEIVDIPITEMPPPPPPEVIKAPEIVEVEIEPEEEPPIELDVEEEEPVEEVYEPIFEEEEEVVQRILVIGEVAAQPEFPGGIDKFREFIASSYVMSSRDIAEENHGRIFLKFVVDKSGKIKDVKILRGISPGCDKEAVRVMQSSPNWIPARDYNGAPVSVRFSIPMVIK